MTVEIELDEVVTNEQIETVAELANIIWTEHYTPIIGKAQVEYMLNEFHSLDAIKEECEKQSVHYYLIYNSEKIVGYAGIRLENSELFLSKIYVLSSERGNGIGRISIEKIKQSAKSNKINNIYLTVNKENTKAIAAYQKLGFLITGEICADIGNGFFMDDYKMELEI